MSQAAYPLDSEVRLIRIFRFYWLTVSTQHSASDGFDDRYLDIDLDDDNPRSSPPLYEQPSSRGSAALHHRAAHPAPPPQRPKFGSGWNLPRPGSGTGTGKRKRDADTFPIARDAHGRALKPVALGSRMKLHRNN